jgi:hypothetical protein
MTGPSPFQSSLDAVLQVPVLRFLIAVSFGTKVRLLTLRKELRAD